MTNLVLLASIAAAGAAGVYVTAGADEIELFNAGLITVDVNDKSGDAVKAVITEAGAAALPQPETQANVGFSGGSAFGTGNAFGGGVSSTTTKEAATVKATTKGVPVHGVLSVASLSKAKIKRNGAKAYDFASLKAPSEMPEGQLDAFFVADVVGEKPRTQTMKSAVSNAKREYATVTGTKPSQLRPGKTENIYDYAREFTIYDNAGPNGEKGAWIARTK
jgi:hypothetical protein